VSQQAFDAFTRRAAAGVTRRSSLATLGGAGLATLIGGSLTVEAKKNNNKKDKKKIKKKSLQKCKGQIPGCENFITANGGNAAQLLCCDFLGTCDSTGFFACLVAAA
jgi:hypothetical protein